MHGRSAVVLKNCNCALGAQAGKNQINHLINNQKTQQVHDRRHKQWRIDACTTTTGTPPPPPPTPYIHTPADTSHRDRHTHTTRNSTHARRITHIKQAENHARIQRRPDLAEEVAEGGGGEGGRGEGHELHPEAGHLLRVVWSELVVYWGPRRISLRGYEALERCAQSPTFVLD